ncbi:hypothetical protein [Pseudocolwellia agarivorans]|uniref:hypothetical protein n=1 Tax=Pseudocolwellia agarivorans TaxID=1911682 RepID=UPI000984478F|nr:hypothetical protein [Pseudocolwellia agarivorans]
MLNTDQIKQLHRFLQEDIELLKLSGDQIPERVGFYLENIPNIEDYPADDLENLINMIINPPS